MNSSIETNGAIYLVTDANVHIMANIGAQCERTLRLDFSIVMFVVQFKTLSNGHITFYLYS